MQDVLARAHHSSEQRQSSAWLGSLLQPPWGDADGIEAALVACVERCTDGWVTVVAPALKLAIELISSNTKKGHSFALSFLGAQSPSSYVKHLPGMYNLPPCLYMCFIGNPCKCEGVHAYRRWVLWYCI